MLAFDLALVYLACGLFAAGMGFRGELPQYGFPTFKNICDGVVVAVIVYAFWWVALPIYLYYWWSGK